MRRVLALGVLFALGCGSTASSPGPVEPDDGAAAEEPPRQIVAAPQPEPTTDEPSREVARPDLDAVLDDGPGAFLGRLEVRPYFDGKKFAGWELVAFRDPSSRLASAGIEPGDVVRRVNEHQLERPEHLQKLWYELRSAHTIVVEGIRGGEPFELRFAVAGKAQTAVPAAGPEGS